MKSIETHPREKGYVLWRHCQNILDDPRNCVIRTVCDMQVDSWHMPWRSKVAWKKLTKNDCCEWKLNQSIAKKGTHGDHVHAASQLL